jgi:hypothetical protein
MSFTWWRNLWRRPSASASRSRNRSRPELLELENRIVPAASSLFGLPAVLPNVSPAPATRVDPVIQNSADSFRTEFQITVVNPQADVVLGRATQGNRAKEVVLDVTIVARTIPIRALDGTQQQMLIVDVQIVPLDSPTTQPNLANTISQSAAAVNASAITDTANAPTARPSSSPSTSTLESTLASIALMASAQPTVNPVSREVTNLVPQLRADIPTEGPQGLTPKQIDTIRNSLPPGPDEVDDSLDYQMNPDDLSIRRSDDVVKINYRMDEIVKIVTEDEPKQASDSEQPTEAVAAPVIEVSPAADADDAGDEE